MGPGTEEHKMELKVGDKVILPAFGGMTVKLEGVVGEQGEGQTSEEELLLFKESEILAKVSN